MARNRPSPRQQEAVARRLALLSAELASVRAGVEASGAPSGGIRPDRAGADPDGHLRDRPRGGRRDPGPDGAPTGDDDGGEPGLDDGHDSPDPAFPGGGPGGDRSGGDGPGGDGSGGDGSGGDGAGGDGRGDGRGGDGPGGDGHGGDGHGGDGAGGDGRGDGRGGGAGDGRGGGERGDHGLGRRVRVDDRPGDDQVSTVPWPGRHASRHASRRDADGPARPSRFGVWSGGLVALGPSQLALVAVLVALGLAVAGWWVLRGEPQELPMTSTTTAPSGGADPLVSLPPEEGSGADASPPASGAPSAATELVVDIGGKVRRPGIAVLPAGARVVDALKAAGGARRGVDLTSLNLARPLVDGEQILVGIPTPGGVVGAVPPTGGSSPAAGLVNVNVADQATLETLPGVGPVTAQAIIAWRESHGGFTTVDELLEVDGIGEATLAELTPYVTV